MDENDTIASELVFGYGDGIVIGPFDRIIKRKRRLDEMLVKPPLFMLN